MTNVSSPISSKAAWIFLAVSCGIATALFVPRAFGYIPQDVANLVFFAYTLVMCLVIKLGTHRNRPQHRFAWHMMFAFSVLLVTGGIAGLVVGRLAPDSNWWNLVNVCYIAAYLPFLLGVASLARLRSPGRDVAGMIDASVVTISFSLLAWVYVYGPPIESVPSTFADLSGLLGVLLGGVFTVWISLRFIMRGSVTPTSLLMLMGTLLTVTADAVAGYLALRMEDPYSEPFWVILDISWIAAQMMWATAALHPSMREVSLAGAQPAGASTSRARIPILAAASLLAPAVLILQVVSGDLAGNVGNAVLIAVCSGVLFLLVACRMNGLVVSERAARDDLERSYIKLQQTEVQLRNAQKLKAIGQLSGGVAHEINTPLQYIFDNARFVKSSFEILSNAVTEPASVDAEEIEFLKEEVPASLTTLLDGLARVSSIVSAMKRFGETSIDGSTKSVDLKQLLEDVVTIVKPELGKTGVVTTRLDGLPPVVCDGANVGQAFLHVLKNGVEAIGRRSDGVSGVITVSSALAESTDAVVLTFTDNGAGISDEIRDRIFEPFFSTKDVGDGSGGQGLALVYAVVTSHGGSIDVMSTVGEGTTVTITLPVRVSRPEVPTDRFGATTGTDEVAATVVA